MRFDILTLFPEIFEPYLSTSIVGRARETAAASFHIRNIRNFTFDKHHTVDDTPYGGGPGMVLKIGPIDEALRGVDQEILVSNPALKRRIVVLSARGNPFNQHTAEEYAALDALTLICGRYEGIDQRVVDYLADEELSIGPYVLAGGELAALVVMEAVTRLLPGVLGSPHSLTEESFAGHGNFLEYPHYTKPAYYNGWAVPEVLLSGDHSAIARWRKQHSKGNS